MTAQPPPAPEVPPPGGPGVAAFFDRIRSYGAVRPDDGRWFAGVAAALARRWGVDPLLVRGGFVILAVFGGVGLLLYGLGWLFLPHPDGRIHAQEVLRGVVTPGFVGGLLCVLLDLGGSGWSPGGWFGPHPFGGGLLLVGLVVLGIWWFSSGRHGRGPGRWGGSGGPHHGAGGPGATGWGGSGWGGSGWGGSGWGSGWGGSGWGGSGWGAGSGGSGSGGSGWGGSGWGGSGTPIETTPPGTPPAPTTRPADSGGVGDSDDRAGATAQEIPLYGTPPPSRPPFSAAPEQPWHGGAGAGSGTTLALAAAPAPAARSRRPDVQRPSHALTSTVIGAAMLGAAVVLLWNLAWGVGAPVGFVAAAVALGIVALGIVVAGFTGRRSGGLAPIGIGLAVVALAGSAATGHVSWAGERTWTPTTLSSDTSYTLGMGDARLDLRQVSAPNATAASPAEVAVRLGVGHLTVVVPTGTAVRVVGTTGAGTIENTSGLQPTAAGATLPAPADRRGPSARVDLQTAPDPVILVRADVGVGNLTIDDATR